MAVGLPRHVPQGTTGQGEMLYQTALDVHGAEEASWDSQDKHGTAFCFVLVLLVSGQKQR